MSNSAESKAAEALGMEVDAPSEQQPIETEAADDVNIDSDADDDAILSSSAMAPKGSGCCLVLLFLPLPPCRPWSVSMRCCYRRSSSRRL